VNPYFQMLKNEPPTKRFIFYPVSERNTMARVIVEIGERERKALHLLAKRERRIPRAQAALIIRQELERQGILPAGARSLQEAQVRGGQ
jgi:hypothetical protein